MELHLFRWHVATDGYVIRELPGEGGKPGGRCLALTNWPHTELRHYGLQRDEPGLFRQFADLDGSDDAILQFARRYGMLGVGQWVASEGEHLLPEPLALWHEETAAMRYGIALWEAWRDGPFDRLAQLVAEDGQAMFWQEERIGSRGTEPWVLALSCGAAHRPEPHVEAEPTPARLAIARLAALIDSRMREHVRARFLVDESTRRPRLAVVPSNLLGGLWCQFADAIDQRRKHRPCALPDCPRWFLEEPTRGPEPKRYCSEACRKRAHYRSNPEKYRRKKEGKTQA